GQSEKRRRVEPGSCVCENTAAWHTLERRNVRVSVDEQVQILRALQLLPSVAAEPASLILGAVGSARVGATLREFARPVGMEHAERFDRETIAHDRPNHSIASILPLAQTIAVLDSDMPFGNRALPRTDDVADPHVVAEYLAAPAVVVACDPEDLNAYIAELRERRESPKTAAWNHCLPLEPEIKEIAVDDQRSRVSRQSAQKRHERSLDLRTGDA